MCYNIRLLCYRAPNPWYLSNMICVSKQVLLMTFKVKVTAADRSSTIARTLIDSGYSASFVHERLAQHLRLPCSNKNAIVEGVAGASTRTQGAIWFHVSGIEDAVEKVGVEAYVLKKMTIRIYPCILFWSPSSGTIYRI